MFTMIAFRGFCVVFSLIVLLCNDTSGCPAGCKCEHKKVTCDAVGSVTDIPSSVPSNTTRLDLTGCRITNLTSESFKNLRSLEEIIMPKQKAGPVVIVDSSVFQGLENLTKVDISDNIISTLKDGLFANLSKLKTVVFTGNPLTTLPEDLFENSPNIAFFSAGKTQLSKDILSKLAQGKFGKNIKAFGISGTKIQILTANFFSGLPKLTHVALDDCGIENIGADILKETKVTYINLDQNPLMNVNANAFRSDSVTIFKCEKCQLTSEITFGFIGAMKSLDILNLNYNNLTYIKKDSFAGLTKLTHVKLMNNSITSIEDNPFSGFMCTPSTCFDLSENPLRCDCDLWWFKRWSTKHNVDQNKLMCQSPSKVTGKNFTELSDEDFCSNPPTSKPTNSGNPVAKMLLMPAIVTQLCLLLAVPVNYYYI